MRHRMVIGRRVFFSSHLYIYKETATGNQLNDKHTITANEIFEAVLKGEGHLTDTSASQYPPFTSRQ
jgi:hypothetical protein